MEILKNISILVLKSHKFGQVVEVVLHLHGQRVVLPTPTENPEWNHELPFDFINVSFQDCDHNNPVSSF
jgi:hypothetical protein